MGKQQSTGRSAFGALVLVLAGLAVAPKANSAELPAAPALAAAPAFRLQDQAGTWHNSSDYRGKWLVLYFYPKDDTPGCTTQACEFRDNLFAFNKLGAVVVGISVDDVASHKQFAEEHSLPFTLLADSTKETAKAYGVLHSVLGLMEIASRETFIIDPEGRIAKHYSAVDPKGHSQAVLNDLRALEAKKTSSFPPATQLAKTTLFASGNEADVRQTRRSAFGRPQVDPKGAIQGWNGTKSAAGDFFQ